MNNQFQRTEILIGTENLNKIKSKTIAIFGIGRCRLLCSRSTSKSRNRHTNIN